MRLLLQPNGKQIGVGGEEGRFLSLSELNCVKKQPLLTFTSGDDSRLCSIGTSGMQLFLGNASEGKQC